MTFNENHSQYSVRRIAARCGILRRRVPKRTRIPLAVGLLGVWLVLGAAGGTARSAKSPGAVARAFAVLIEVPGQPSAGTSVLTAPPRGQTSFLERFAYPGDGSVVQTGAVTVAASTAIGHRASATASSDVTALSLFRGELTADGVSGRARAGVSGGAASGDTAGAAVANLVVLGQTLEATPGLRVPLADWGYAVVLAQSTDPSAPKGAKGFRASLVALDVRLTADHGGLPAGSEIQIGYAEAAAQTAPPEPAPAPETPTGTPHDEVAGARVNVPKTSKLDLRALAKKGPLKLHPKLTAGGYVFPVFGPTAYGDSFGTPRADVRYHHGDDIFGEFGQPVLAVADGQLFDLGWQDVGGYRVWLRDRQGNQFYYAHLSAFAAAAHNGAHLKAGAVIGFMGTTGDAIGTPPHLHFEIHPVSLLFLGYDGAVDPTSYLDAWSKAEDVKFPTVAGWAPPIGGGVPAPEPGAILLGSSDISTADGLDPESVARALKAPLETRPYRPYLPGAGPLPVLSRG